MNSTSDINATNSAESFADGVHTPLSTPVESPPQTTSPVQLPESPIPEFDLELATQPLDQPIDRLADATSELVGEHIGELIPEPQVPSYPLPIAHDDQPASAATASTTVNLKIDEDEATFLINSLQVKNEHFSRKLKTIIGDHDPNSLELTFDAGTMQLTSAGTILLTTSARHLGNYGDCDGSTLWAWNEATRLEHAAGPNPLSVSANSFVAVKDKMVITYIMAVLAQKYEHIYQTGTDVISVYGINSS